MAEYIDIYLGRDIPKAVASIDTIKVTANMGERGPRGSRIFTGATLPDLTTDTIDFFAYENEYQSDDMFIIDSGVDTGKVYVVRENASGVPFWQYVFTLQAGSP